MRIWIINHYAAPPVMAGGTRHYNFAKQLMQRGHEVTLIAANYNHFSHRFVESATEPGVVDNSYEVPFIWIPTPTYSGNTIARFQNMLSFSGKLLLNKYLPRHAQPDVIIGSSPHLFAALGAEWLARRLKVPFILEIRDLWPESLVDLGRISTKHPLIIMMRQIEKYLYKRAKAIISLLPSADQYLIKQGVKPENILWLPNTVDIDAIPANLTPGVSDKFTFMYAGAHGLANNLDTVLHAAYLLEKQKRHQRIQIVLIGSGPEKQRLQALAQSLNLTMVTFKDPVSKSEIYHELNKADAYLMLLQDSPVFRWGISPNKLFDYLAMARPVIFGVNTPFNPVEQCQAGISIKPSDPEALASAILQLAETPRERLNEMGQRGKEYVLKYHHINALSDTLETLLLKVSHAGENMAQLPKPG